MFNLKKFLKPSTDAPALNSLFAPHCFVDDHIVMTKTNALCALLEIRGIDDECASDDDLDAQGKRIQNALKQFDESYTLYQYVIKDDAEPLAVLDSDGQSNSVIETLERRRQFLEAKGLHSVRIVYAILLDHATTRVKLVQPVPGGASRVSETKLRNDLALLLAQVESFKQAVDDVLHPRLLNKFEVFSFLRFLTSLNREAAESEALKYDVHVDYFMANTPITFERERGAWRLSVNESPVEVLTVKESPAETMPSVLRSLLGIPGKFVLCAQFKRVLTEDAVKEILTSKGYFARASKNQTKGAFLEKSVKPVEIGIMGFGERGAGKSVFGSLLIDHAQKRKPKTFIMHLGNSYRETTRKHHGTYAEMRFGDGRQTFRINPFVIPGTDENKSFLVQFVKSLLAESGYECNGDDGEHIFNTVSTVYRWEARDRRLGMFAEGLRPGIKKAMRPWVGNGQFAPVFDNEVDTLTFSDFQTFDFQGMDRKYPQVLEPLLFYIFQRISEVVTDPRFAMTEKYLWLDEGWKFLMNKTTREYFIEAAKTWRHYNAGVGILTQSAADLQGPGVFDALSELCPVKVLLASPGAKVSTYRDLFKLNERTADIFAGLIPRRQALVGTPAGWKRVEILLDEQAIAEYGSAPAEVMARNAVSDRETETVLVAGA